MTRISQWVTALKPESFLRGGTKDCYSYVLFDHKYVEEPIKSHCSRGVHVARKNVLRMKPVRNGETLGMSHPYEP